MNASDFRLSMLLTRLWGGRTVRPTSVRARLTLTSMAVQAFTLMVMGVVLWLVVRATLLASVDRELEQRGHGFARRWGHWSGFLRDNPFPRWFRRPPELDEPPSKGETAAAPLATRRPSLFTLTGEPMEFGPPPFDTAGSPMPLRPLDSRAFVRARDGQETITTVAARPASLRVFSFPLQRGGQTVGVAQSAYSLQEVDRALRSLTRALLTLIPLSLLVTGLSGMLQTHRLLRPVRRLTRTAARIEAADLSARLPVVGEDEFAHLSRTFNAMLARLEQAFEQQRRFAADASHELRTPLTAIKAHTSLALSGEKTEAEYRIALQGADRSATLMMQIVQDLLLMARLDADRQQVALVPVALHDVLEAAIDMVAGEDHAPLYREAFDASLCVLGDASQLTRLFSNLLSNAVRHTPADGCITIRVERAGENVRVAVVDTGAGIAPEHLPHLGERFYRVDSARSRKQGGTGLGLAISRGIAIAHGGRLTIESEVGRGTTVTILLPLLSN